ncbi:MAG: hypothetical protein RL328_742 [Acidobacteriota bacterium]|jgi:4-amino-4-deoxy-L-arabinose transferase-like glycosyltransferase
MWSRGYSYYFGDAEAHLNIARRILDSRTPGGSQIGTVWLPLPHLLLAPFTLSDQLWINGLAGVIPSVLVFGLAGTLLYKLAARVFGSEDAGVAAALLFAANPTMLYLASAPMTEPMMAAAMVALLLATLWYRDAQSVPALLAVAVAANAAALTRYEGWFLLPFVTLYLWRVARNKQHVFILVVLASLAPVAWLAHNQFYYGDSLAFYRGPYSAQAILQRQLGAGMVNPAAGDWTLAAEYYAYAVRDVVRWPLVIVAGTGLLAAVYKRAFWPLLFLLLPGVFYIWSVRSGGTPVFVPELEPYSPYNTRYALALLPAAAFAGAALVAILPAKIRNAAPFVLALVVLIGEWQWPVSISWEEARRGSEVRRIWQPEAAAYLRENYRPGAGLIFFFGDLSGVLRQAGIPLRETVYQDNRAAWDAAMDRESAFASQEWALAVEGDAVDRRIRQLGDAYRLEKRIEVKGAPAVLIYRRT